MRISKTGRSTDCAGFTLIELALTIFLIGLFSALVIPRLPDLGSGDPDRSARRIAGTVKFLFNEAALTGLEQRLTFDLDHALLRPRTLKGDGELVTVRGLTDESRLPRGIRLIDVKVSGQEKVTSGETTTAILPAGWLPETVVHLGTDGGEVLTVRLLSYTGSAEVYDGYREF